MTPTVEAKMTSPLLTNYPISMIVDSEFEQLSVFVNCYQKALKVMAEEEIDGDKDQEIIRDKK